jgi:hypothetical protein
LKVLHELKWLHDQMQAGGYDLVILQEDIPELTEHSVAPFFEQGRLFDQEIRQLGSKTVLFMAWHYERLNWVTLEQIAKAHRAIGKELGEPVTPVDVAFQREVKERPELAMLGRYKEHESINGTYLAANVIKPKTLDCDFAKFVGANSCSEFNCGYKNLVTLLSSGFARLSNSLYRSL